MLSLTAQKIYEYFGIEPNDRVGHIKDKVEYINNLVRDFSGDDMFRFLIKYDFDGAPIDRLSGVWKKLRYGEISRELVSEMQPPVPYKPSSVPQVESEAPSSTKLATDAVSSNLSLPRGISTWTI